MAKSSAEDTTSPRKTQNPLARTSGPLAAWWVMGLGWLLPGMGYFVARKWVRGSLVLVCVAAMFLLGLKLKGEVYSYNLGDILDILGFVGDLCAGVLYFMARAAGAGIGNLYSVMGNYGTSFLIGAGLLNLLAASDSRDVYLGRKQ